jgi:hypothetical protein
MIWPRISDDRGEVEPEAGVGDDQHVDVAGELAREHRPLHVAARQRLDRRVGRGRLDAVAAISSAPSCASDPATATSRGWRSAACRRSGSAMFSATAHLGAVAFFSGSSGRPKTLKRSKSLPASARTAGCCTTMRPSVERPSGRTSVSTRALWPLPETPGDADDLAALPPSGSARSSAGSLHVVDGARAPASSSFGVAGRCETSCGRRARGSPVSPIISRAHLVGRHLTGLCVAPTGEPAAAQDRQGIAEGRHLAELVGDHQHRQLAALVSCSRSSPSISSASCGVSTEVGSSRIRKRWSR